MNASTERLVASCGLRWFHYRSWKPPEVAAQMDVEPVPPAEVARPETPPTVVVPVLEAAPAPREDEAPLPERAPLALLPVRERGGLRGARGAPVVVLPPPEHLARQHVEGQRKPASSGPARRFALLDELNSARSQPAVSREGRPSGPVPLRDRRDWKET